MDDDPALWLGKTWAAHSQCIGLGLTRVWSQVNISQITGIWISEWKQNMPHLQWYDNIHISKPYLDISVTTNICKMSPIRIFYIDRIRLLGTLYILFLQSLLQNMLNCICLWHYSPIGIFIKVQRIFQWFSSILWGAFIIRSHWKLLYTTPQESFGQNN